MNPQLVFNFILTLKTIQILNLIRLMFQLISLIKNDFSFVFCNQINIKIKLLHSQDHLIKLWINYFQNSDSQYL